MIPISLDQAIKLARTEEEILKMGGALSPKAEWALRCSIEKVVKEMDKFNWQPCVYGTRPSVIGERQKIIDRSYKTPSPFIRIEKISEPPLLMKRSWFSAAAKSVWIAIKTFLMLYGAWWVVYFIAKAIG